MSRVRRDFTRRSGTRDASLVVIACEGAETEPRYFNDLKVKLHNSRLHVEVLLRDEPSECSPEAVLGMLNEFARNYKLRGRDSLWLVCDRDPRSWKPAMMADVARECSQKDYSLAVSNPCFELWLLLHFEDVPSQPPPRQQELFENRDDMLKRSVAAHRQANVPDIERYFPNLEIAIARGRLLDAAPQDRWPNGLGTHVYRLIERMLPEPHSTAIPS